MTQAGIAYVTVAYDPAGVQKLREETRAQGQQLANSWSQSAKKIGSSLTRVGGTLTRTLSLPLTVAGAAAAKYTYDFDQSLNHIQSLVGANTKQMDYYRKSILALSPAVAQGPKELADALYFVTSSGFKGAAAMRVLEASAKGAASGLGDTKTIADLVTSAINVYGEKNLSASKAVDVLTQAVKDGKGEPAQYATAMGRVIPVAQNLGVSFDQVGAALAALTLGGFSADKATTGLQSIFTNLEKPSKSAVAALKSVGLSAGGIRKEITDKGLLPALLDLNKAFDGNGVALRKVFTNGKAIVPFLSLTGQAAQKNVGIFHDLATSTGASEKAFSTQSKTTAFQVQQALAKIQVAAVQVGGIILPVFANLATHVADIASAFGGLPQGFQQVVIGAGVAAVALGPLLTVMGNVAKATAFLSTALTALTPSASRAAPALYTVSASATEAEAASSGLAASLLGPVGIAAAAVAVGYAFYKLTSPAQTVGQAMDAAAQSADNLATAFAGLKPARLGVKQALLDHANAADAADAAQKTLAQDINNGLKGTKQYTTDLRAQKQAQLDVGGTTVALQAARQRLIEQNAAVTKSETDQVGRQQDLARALRLSVTRQSALIQEGGRYIHGAALQAEQLKLTAAETAAFSGKTHDLAAAQIDAAHKLGGFSTAAGTGKIKAAALSLAASDLTDRIGKIPSKKNILIYYKNNMQNLIDEALRLGSAISAIPIEHNTTIRTYHINSGPSSKPNAKGGIFAHASGGVFNAPTLVGNNLFGEAGKEAVVPLESQSGRTALRQAVTDALGGTEFNFYLDGKAIDARVERRNKATARALTAGSRWG